MILAREGDKESEEVKELLKTDCVRSRLLKLKEGISAKIRMQESQSVNYGNGISDFQK